MNYLTRAILICFCLLLGAHARAIPLLPLPLSDEETDSFSQRVQEIKPDTAGVLALLEMASSFYDVDAKRGLICLRRALFLSDSLQYERGISASYFGLGNAYMNSADYRQSLFYFFKALRRYEAMKKYENQARTLNNIGAAYTYLQNADMAEKYYGQALALREKHNMPRERGMSYIGLGLASLRKHANEKAKSYFSIAYKEGIETNNKYLIRLSLSNLGEVSVVLKDFDKAKKYFQLVLNDSVNTKDKHSIAFAFHNLGQIYFEEKSYAQAETFFLHSLKTASDAGLQQLQFESHEELAKVYFAIKNYKKAYEHQAKFMELSRKSMNEDALRQITELQTKYEIDNKNKEIQLLNKDKQIAESEVAEQHLLRNIFIAAFIIALLMSIIFGRNVMLKQKVNTLLNEKTERIEAQKIVVEKQNKELINENIVAKYEVLKSKIDPHFLFNSLSTLSSLVMRNQHDAVSFIGHFSDLYRMILESGSRELITLQDEMKVADHYLYLQQYRFGNSLEVTRNVPADHLRMMLPPFALQMSIENAIKHNIISSSKKLHIRIEATDHLLIITNNLQRKNTMHSTSTGQQNIAERYALLGDQKPTFTEAEETYVVVLPLLPMLKKVHYELLNS